ncbi:MAG: ABC-ATPase domain-containing protein, partial [Lachnospiraceae bacterium]|nr:ABC-ATPase domain-containing protein [Lachnospiraceae bacterium]
GMKIRAEDGRSVYKEDISLFILNLPIEVFIPSILRKSNLHRLFLHCQKFIYRLCNYLSIFNLLICSIQFC